MSMTWSPDTTGSIFPDPFMDYASRVIPTNLRQAIRFCEGLFYYNPLVRETARRVLSVFITEIELKGAHQNKLDMTERDKHVDFLVQQLQVYQRFQEAWLDYLAVGNTFISLVVPVKRFLYCTECQKKKRYTEYPIRTVLRDPSFGFRWRMPKFFATCSRCEKETEWERVDRRSDGDDAVIRRWPANQIDIRYDEHRDSREYIWLIPSTYRRKVKNGDPQVLESVPWEVVEAVQIDGNILFDKDYVFHAYEPTLSGLDTQGWGIPRAIVNARPAWLFQILNRQNEAISIDYLTPMRWISPDIGSSSDAEASDPLASIDMGDLQSTVEQAIDLHRRDPATHHFSPYPLKYTLMGGEAKQLATPELLNQAADTLLNAMGFPASLFRGDLTEQTAVPALRLFQSYWTHLVRGMNDMLSWVCGRVGEERGWEPVTASLISPTLIDDVELVMAKLQMSQSGDISKTTAVRAVGANYRTELEQQADEQRMQRKIQEELAEEAQDEGILDNIAQQQAAAQQGGDPNAQGGQPAQQGGGAAAGVPATQALPLNPNQKITPQEITANADAEAGRLLGMSEGERQSAMQQLKAKDPTMHAQVKAMVESKRQAARTQGGNQLLQQQYGGGG